MNSGENIQEVAAQFQSVFLLPVPTGITYRQLHNWLSQQVATLLKNDFSRLIQLLYQLDVSEEKLKYLLQQNKDEMAASIIATLLIERQQQKIETRRQFKKNDNIPDDDRW